MELHIHIPTSKKACCGKCESSFELVWMMKSYLILPGNKGQENAEIFGMFCSNQWFGTQKGWGCYSPTQVGRGLWGCVFFTSNPTIIPAIVGEGWLQNMFFWCSALHPWWKWIQFNKHIWSNGFGERTTFTPWLHPLKPLVLMDSKLGFKNFPRYFWGWKSLDESVDDEVVLLLVVGALKKLFDANWFKTLKATNMYWKYGSMSKGEKKYIVKVSYKIRVTVVTFTSL